MKNTFAVTMTLLLALALGGSYAGYRIATTPHEAGNAAEGNQAAGGPPAAASTSPQTAANGQQGPGSPSADMAGNTGTVAGTGQGGTGQVSGGKAAGTTATTGPAGSNADTVNANGGALGGEMTANGTPGKRSEETPQAATGNNTSTNEVKPVSPTAQGSQGTELGQTGTTNTEKALAGNPAVSNSTAAAVASATAGDTAQGQRLFASNCAGCHGATAGGGIGPALNTATGPGSWMVSQFEAAVREGHAPDRELAPMMPHFTTAQLSDENLTDIYAYLKSLVK